MKWVYRGRWRLCSLCGRVRRRRRLRWWNLQKNQNVLKAWKCDNEWRGERIEVGLKGKGEWGEGEDIPVKFNDALAPFTVV